MTADEKLSELTMYFNLYDFALFMLMMKLERRAIADKNLTIAIGVQPGHLELLYNSDFVLNTPDTDLLECVKLELTRLLLQHPTLRVKEDRKMSYEASNAVMTEYYPGTNLSKALSSNKPPVTKDTFEEYYYWLFDQQQNSPPSPGNGPGQGNGQSNGSGALNNHVGNSQGNSQHWNKNDTLAEQIKDFVREYEQQIKSSSLLGSGSLKEMILKANAKSEVSPEKLLRAFVKSIESEKMIDTRMKLNRRFELEVPGYRKDLEYDCLVGIDVSGSISQSEIKRFVNIITACAKAAHIKTVSWDTSVYEKKPISLTRFRKPKVKIAQGGGGTDPECVIEYAKKQKIKNLILLTDGCFQRLDTNKGLKICFVCTETPSYEENLKKLGKYILLKLKRN